MKANIDKQVGGRYINRNVYCWIIKKFFTLLFGQTGEVEKSGKEPELEIENCTDERLHYGVFVQIVIHNDLGFKNYGINRSLDLELQKVQQNY
jgi:hypothetical protein